MRPGHTTGPGGTARAVNGCIKGQSHAGKEGVAAGKEPAVKEGSSADALSVTRLGCGRGAARCGGLTQLDHALR